MRQTLLAEVELRTTTASRALDDRLAAFDRAQAANLKNVSDDLRRLASDTALRIASETATAQLKDMRAQILAEMRTVAREEVTVGVRDQVKTSVNEAVKEQFASVPALIATEVRRTSTTTNPRLNLGGGVVGGGIIGGGQ